MDRWEPLTTTSINPVHVSAIQKIIHYCNYTNLPAHSSDIISTLYLILRPSWNVEADLRGHSSNVAAFRLGIDSKVLRGTIPVRDAS